MILRAFKCLILPGPDTSFIKLTVTNEQQINHSHELPISCGVEVLSLSYAAIKLSETFVGSTTKLNLKTMYILEKIVI
jgi:hypothetical protein